MLLLYITTLRSDLPAENRNLSGRHRPPCWGWRRGWGRGWRRGCGRLGQGIPDILQIHLSFSTLFLLGLVKARPRR